MKIAAPLLLGLLSFLFAPAWPADRLKAADLDWPAATEIPQGEMAVLKIHSDAIVKVEGRLGKETIYFYGEPDGSFTAIVGADLEVQPKATVLTLEATTIDGGQVSYNLPVTFTSKAFKEESFTVAKGFDQYDAAAIKEIRREQAAFARAFAASAPDRLWEVPFIRPVPQEASASSFGSRRIINGKRRSPHTGTDLSSPMGTEVLAANHGKVVLVGEFYFAGGSVVIDHGGGLFTMYFHLSELRVEEGMMVRRGEVIALSGKSGRVTGPHLHWGARLANARIEPLELLRKLPGDLPAAQTVRQSPIKLENEYGAQGSSK